MARSINSATITFGLVSIPVKFYVATSEVKVEFNMLTPAGNRVKQKLTDSVTGEEVMHADCDKGFEYASDQFVRFTKDEIKALQAECSSKTVDIKEFVDADSVDLIGVESTYYLGPNKGGDKAYRLLADAMVARRKYAVAQWNAWGKEHLVIIRPYRGGLVLHQMYYANEIRDFSEIEAAPCTFLAQERDMAEKLIAKFSTGSFDPTKYKDSFTERVQAAVQNKIAGETVTVVPREAKSPSLFDLFGLLKASLDKEVKAEEAVVPAPVTQQAGFTSPEAPTKAGKKRSPK